MDIFTKTQRSRIMSSISGKETKPEILVRKYLFKHGFRFRKNVKTLPGTPDIVLPKYRTVVFINGCFWHGHYNCKKAYKPITNAEFWAAKIQKNMERDERVMKQLQELSWKVITIWECDIKSKDKFDNTMRALIERLVK